MLPSLLTCHIHKTNSMPSMQMSTAQIPSASRVAVSCAGGGGAVGGGGAAGGASKTSEPHQTPQPVDTPSSSELAVRYAVIVALLRARSTIQDGCNTPCIPCGVSLVESGCIFLLHPCQMNSAAVPAVREAKCCLPHHFLRVILMWWHACWCVVPCAAMPCGALHLCIHAMHCCMLPCTAVSMHAGPSSS